MRPTNVGIRVSDQVIINNVLNGDIAQFNALILRHKDYAYTLALSIVHNAMDAEEIAHDAFIKAYKSLASFNQQAKFTTWLYRIVFNTAISHLRKKSVPTEDIAVISEQPPGDDYSDGEVIAQDREKYIRLALEKLTPADTALITLFYMQQHSLEEIGEILNTRPATIKVKLFRARKRLARALEEILSHEVQTIL